MLVHSRAFVPLDLFCVPVFQHLIQKQLKNFDIILDRVRKRSRFEGNRPDFISSMVKHNSEKDMTSAEAVFNASLLIAAGTETVATLLPAVTYLPARNPRTMARATSEIRKTFDDEIPINIHSISNLKYLSAVIDEALRLFSPVPEGPPRVTSPKGDFICGRWIPGKLGLSSVYPKSPLNMT